MPTCTYIKYNVVQKKRTGKRVVTQKLRNKNLKMLEVFTSKALRKSYLKQDTCENK